MQAVAVTFVARFLQMCHQANMTHAACNTTPATLSLCTHHIAQVQYNQLRLCSTMCAQGSWIADLEGTPVVFIGCRLHGEAFLPGGLPMSAVRMLLQPGLLQAGVCTRSGGHSSYTESTLSHSITQEHLATTSNNCTSMPLINSAPAEKCLHAALHSPCNLGVSCPMANF